MKHLTNIAIAISVGATLCLAAANLSAPMGKHSHGWNEKSAETHFGKVEVEQVGYIVHFWEPRETVTGWSTNAEGVRVEFCERHGTVQSNFVHRAIVGRKVHDDLVNTTMLGKEKCECTVKAGQRQVEKHSLILEIK